MKDRVYIIAEAGVNHNGSLDTALKMIDAAADAGADAVKFQTFTAKELITKTAEKAEYQKELTNPSENQFDMVKKLELTCDDHIRLIGHAKDRGIDFMSSPFDIPSIEMLDGLGVEVFKIPSGEVVNLPYLRRLAACRKKYIISTGMCSMSEIDDFLEVFLSAGCLRNDIVLLHANTEYPTPYEDVNLLAMVNIGKNFKMRFGYSDHTLGIEVPIAAVAMGACVIEKHFTLDKKAVGPDHKASLDAAELRAMVSAIRNIEMAIGDGIKRPSASERKNIQIARKSIVARTAIKKGEVFTEENLTTKRPGTGVSPMRWDSFIGRAADRDYTEDDLIDDI